MKWTYRAYRRGDTKTVTKFLWLPVMVERGNYIEIRWLCRATIIKKLCVFGWENVGFCDEKPISKQTDLSGC